MNPDEASRRARSARFTPIRIREGYDMGEVDRFLDEIEAAARRRDDLGSLLRTANFTRVKWREGYTIEEVDRFVAEMLEIEDTRAGQPATAPPETTSAGSAWAIRSLVERARFTPVRLREGYDMGEVDALLDDVVEAAERGEPVGPVIDRARFTPVRLREGYDMSEVDRLLAQLKGTGPVTLDPGVVQEQRGLFARLLGRR